MPEAIYLERLVAYAKGELTGTEAEVTAYLYTASLVAPMDSDHMNIYVSVSLNTMNRVGRVHLTTDIPGPLFDFKELTGYQIHLLTSLRDQIFRARLKARKRVK